ncbi:MAG: Asp-tRNA(Asn)/Glu-tRNA(Gln) amidotransferase subunit GatC [Bacillota bacterium]
MLSKEEVNHLASLSKLDLTEEEVAEFTNQLGDVLDYINKIMEIDTEGVKPTYHPREAANVLREDKITNEDRREELLEAAPDKIDDQFRVPGRK